MHFRPSDTGVTQTRQVCFSSMTNCDTVSAPGSPRPGRAKPSQQHPITHLRADAGHVAPWWEPTCV
jgi:hypothetical protein